VADRECRFRKQRSSALPVIRPCAPVALERHGEAGLMKRTIASDATYSVAGNRIASQGTAASWVVGSHCIRGRGAIDAVSRIVELVRGSKPASPC
jgi:hypothetical protein